MFEFGHIFWQIIFFALWIFNTPFSLSNYFFHSVSCFQEVVFHRLKIPQDFSTLPKLFVVLNSYLCTITLLPGNKLNTIASSRLTYFCRFYFSLFINNNCWTEKCENIEKWKSRNITIKFETRHWNSCVPHHLTT